MDPTQDATDFDATGLTTDTGFQTYLTQDTSGSVDNNAGVNPLAAAGTAPIITDSASGQSTVTPASVTPAVNPPSQPAAAAVTPSAAASSGFFGSLVTGLTAAATTAATTAINQAIKPLTPTSNATPSGTPAKTATAVAATKTTSMSTYIMLGAAAVIAVLLFRHHRRA